MDHLNLELIVQLIISACVLHNICLLHDDFDPGYMLDDDGDYDDNDGDSSNSHDGGSASGRDRQADLKVARLDFLGLISPKFEH